MARPFWFRKLFARTPHTARQAPARCRPQLEALEDRLVPAAPVVVTGAAVVSSSGATLNGTVNPEGSTATALFQYSTDPTFSPTVATTIGSGFSSPEGLAVDAAGDVFVANAANSAVKEVLPNGTIKTIGSGFINPGGVAVDAAGDVFVANTNSTAVKEVLPDGTIKTIGSGFIHPGGVAVDAAGDVFVADQDNNAVKEVLPDGTIKTIGSGFSTPFGVAVDAAGDVFVADQGNNAVEEVLPDGTIKTIGSGFFFPFGVAVDAAGDVFVADSGHNAVKEVLPNGTIKTIGSGFYDPIGVAVDAAGDVFVDSGNRVVELSPPTVAATPPTLTGSQDTAVSANLTGLSPDTVYYYRAVATGPGGTVAAPAQSFLSVPPPAVATVAATAVTTTQATLNGTVNPEGPPATALFQYSTDPTFTPTVASTIGAGFQFATGVAVDAAGDVFVADYGNNAVREVLPDGTIRAIGSDFNQPADVAVDAAGDVFVADGGSDGGSMTVKEVLPDGTINTIASGFSYPYGVAVDAAGDVFVADYGNSAVKEVLPNGTIRTIGSGFSPYGVAVDAAGDVFVADFGNNAVKEVLPNGTIRTIGAGFKNPTRVAVDAAGDVFVADSGHNAVKEVLPNGTIRAIGSGFFDPLVVAVDAAGDVFVADSPPNNRVVELSPPAVAATPSVVSGPTATAVSANLTGLAPGTTYYDRVVATGPGGTVADSLVQSFTTQVATSFANLTGGSIPFGTASVNLSGKLATTPGTPFPTGSVVTVSIDGVAETATLNPGGSFQLDYQFSAALNNLPLGVAQSPYAITYAYTDPSGTFAPASDSSQALTITQAAPKVGVADAGGTYDGAAFAASATVAGVVAGVDATPAATLEGVAPTLSYYSGSYTSLAQLAGLTPLGGAPVSVGAYTVLASFAGSADYGPAQALAAFAIAQASPTVTWASPADIVYGTPLSAAQLDATADAPGTFAYSPAAGTVLGAGAHTLSVTFTPTDTADYNPATASVTLTVNKATLTVTADDATRIYGVANPAFTAGYSGFVNGQDLASSGVTGSPSLSTAATPASLPGPYSISAAQGTLAAANYAFAFVNGTLAVNPDTLTGSGQSITTPVGAPFAGDVATFSDDNPNALPGDFTASIDWGDGQTSAGVVRAAGGGFTVSGGHTYTRPGPFTPTVQLQATGVTPATFDGPAAVGSAAVIPGTGGDDSLVLTRTAGGGAGAVTYALDGAAPVSLTGVTSFTFAGGAGSDTFTVGYGNGTPLLRGGIAFDGGSGVNYLVVDDSASSAATTLTVTDGQVTTRDGTATVAVSYRASGRIGSVEAVTGAGRDMVLVQSTTAGANTVVACGGADNIYVSSAVGKGGNLSGLRGPLAIDARAGRSFLTVSDAGGSGPDTFTLTGSAVTDAAGLSIAYTASGGSFAGVNLATGPGAVRVNVQSTAAGAITGVLNFGGADTIDVCSDTVHNQGDLRGLKGPLLVEPLGGTDLLVVSEAGRQTGDDVVVTATGLGSGVGAGFVVYYTAAGGTFTGINFASGSGDDRFAVQGTPAGVPVALYTGGGNDIINVGVSADSGTDLTVVGGPTGSVVLGVADESGAAALDSVATGLDSGLVQLLYAGKKPSTITYLDVDQVFTSPPAAG
jgi:hypothetical protein